MSLFGLLGTQHATYNYSGSASSMGSDDKNANDENDFEYEFQSSDPDVIATNIIIYRQKLKMVRVQKISKIEKCSNYCVHYILDCNYRQNYFYSFIPLLLSSL